MSNLRLIVCALYLASTIAAQLRPGHGIVTFHSTTNQSLAVFSPRSRAPVTPLAGLPAELTYAQRVSSGPFSARILRDGRVLAGNIAWDVNFPVALHVLTIADARVTSSVRIPLGQATHRNAKVVAIELLPDGRALVATEDVQGVPPFQIFDPATNRLSPWNVAGLPVAALESITMHEGSSRIYVMMRAASLAAIYRIPLASGAAMLEAFIPSNTREIVAASDGSILLPSAAGLRRYDPSNGQVTSLNGAPTILYAIAEERSTGLIICPDRYQTTIVLFNPSTGSQQIIADIPFARIGDVDLAEPLVVYGTGSPSPLEFHWRLPTDSNGLPSLGNSSFQIVLDAPQGNSATATALLIGGQRTQQTLLGINLLVDPASAIVLPLIPADTINVQLPIPSNPALAGLELHAQAIHVEGSALGSSRGLTIRIVQP